MRDFSWTYFAMTGDVDAFLLYKEVDKLRQASGAAGANMDIAAEDMSDIEQTTVL